MRPGFPRQMLRANGRDRYQRLQAALAFLLAGTTVAQNASLVTDGQQFVRVVQTFAQNGGSVSYRLANISMSLAVFQAPSANQTLAPGTLLLDSSAPSRQPVTLDSAMKSDLTKPWILPGTNLVWQNLILTNLCSEWLAWNPGANLWILSSSNTWLLPRARALQTQTRTNVTMYVPYSEVLSMTYWQIMANVPFDRIQANVRVAVLPPSVVPYAQSIIASNTMYSISADYMNLPGGKDYFVSYRATNNPNDPLGLNVANGKLMSNRLCDGPTGNGPNLTPDNLNRNMTVFPTWISNNTTLRADMGEIANAFIGRPSSEPVPLLLLVENATMQPFSASGAFTFRGDLLLSGPANLNQRITLSLSDSSDLLYMNTDANLFLYKLTLTGLISKPLPTNAAYKSSLPMWGLNPYMWGSSIALQANNITLVVPQDDFAALLSASQRGSAWQTGAVTTAPLMSGISVFIPSPSNVAGGRDFLQLTNYTGWGMNAVEMRIIPVTPLGLNYSLPDPAVPAPPTVPPASGGSSGATKSQALGVGIGVGIGGTLLIAAAAFGIWKYRQMRQGAKYAGDVEASPEAKPAGGKGVDPATPGAYPARDLIHKAVSQAQEAMKGSDSVASSERAITTCNSRQNGGGGDAHSLDGASGGLGNGAVVAGVKRETEPGVAPSGAGTAVATGGNATPEVASALASAMLESKAQGSAPRSSDSVRTLDPLKAVQLRAGQIQRADADKLTLLSVLGRGAWGTVYKGTWRGLTVAVKTVLFSEREDGDTTLPHERAIMEAAVCTSVAHRNVVATYHYDIKPVRMVSSTNDEGLQVEAADDPAALGITDWKLFLVQEWCNSTLGQALRSWLLHKKATREPLIDLLLELLLDCASGINYLHDKNIIHGDLKPENVMLKTDSSAQIGVVAKITDFGLSTTLGPQATHVSNYKSGTPFYVAPEVTAQGRTTKASDTYSMGVLMWEAYCCMPPWIKVGSEYQANSRFPTFPSNCPAPFIKLAKSCLDLDVKRRPTFPTIVATLRGMLDAWQQGYDSLEPAPGAPVTATMGRQPSAKPAIGGSGSAAGVAAAATKVTQDSTAASATNGARMANGASGTGIANGSGSSETAAAAAAGEPESENGDRDASALLSEWVRNANPGAKPEAKPRASKE